MNILKIQAFAILHPKPKKTPRTLSASFCSLLHGTAGAPGGELGVRQVNAVIVQTGVQLDSIKQCLGQRLLVLKLGRTVAANINVRQLALLACKVHGVVVGDVNHQSSLGLARNQGNLLADGLLQLVLLLVGQGVVSLAGGVDLGLAGIGQLHGADSVDLALCVGNGGLQLSQLLLGLFQLVEVRDQRLLGVGQAVIALADVLHALLFRQRDGIVQAVDPANHCVGLLLVRLQLLQRRFGGFQRGERTVVLHQILLDGGQGVIGGAAADAEVKAVIDAIPPEKDVDGFHPSNGGRMMLGMPTYIPATPYGIKQLLERSEIETEGKHCVVLGRSNIVGTPMAILMSRNSKKANCTVTLCHSKTKNIKEICRSADILIVAIGKPEFVTADMVKDGAVVIDVGIHRVEADNEKGYKIIGDVKFDEVAPKCKAITPVPGGVGPMTIVSLLDNTMKAYKHEIYEAE